LSIGRSLSGWYTTGTTGGAMRLQRKKGKKFFIGTSLQERAAWWRGVGNENHKLSLASSS
jgi:hypothetical protein